MLNGNGFLTSDNTELSLVMLPITHPQGIAATLSESALRYMKNAKSNRTRHGYRSDFKHFTAFCDSQNLLALPATPATVAAYLVMLADAGFKTATLSRRLTAISNAHGAARFDSPTSTKHAVVKEVWSGIRRTVGTAQVRKAAATTDHLKRMLAQVPNTTSGSRDRAILLLGFAGALRRSEIVALRVEDVACLPEGLVLAIRGSKTDQERAGENVAIVLGPSPKTCPVQALREWLLESGISTGPLFRRVDRWSLVGDEALSDQVVALLVKKYAGLAGLDTTLFSGHSLRAGLATSAAHAGATERTIMRQTRHKSEAMVRRYIRAGTLFHQNVSAMVGL
jgi:site-specific recombinase XerD